MAQTYTLSEYLYEYLHRQMYDIYPWPPYLSRTEDELILIHDGTTELDQRFKDRDMMSLQSQIIKAQPDHHRDPRKCACFDSVS